MPLSYVYGQDELVAGFVVRMKHAAGARAVGFDVKKIRTIGVLDKDNELIAGLVYYNFHPGSGLIEISVEALPKRNWLTRSTLAVMFQYPFLQCKCQMLMSKTGVDNEVVLRVMAALNFKFIMIPRMYGRDQDGVLCLLTDDDWKASKTCKRFKHDQIQIQPQSNDAERTERKDKAA